mmetsp:Transcript_3989/g.13195  ORF Transcript_3989/g.13195 Transcript_3989/m.13195 type:complete len:203 (+) Transcript_3989:370-978(+)
MNAQTRAVKSASCWRETISCRVSLSISSLRSSTRASHGVARRVALSPGDTAGGPAVAPLPPGDTAGGPARWSDRTGVWAPLPSARAAGRGVGRLFPPGRDGNTAGGGAATLAGAVPAPGAPTGPPDAKSGAAVAAAAFAEATLTELVEATVTAAAGTVAAAAAAALKDAAETRASLSFSERVREIMSWMVVPNSASSVCIRS